MRRNIDERTVRIAVEIQQFLADYWRDVDENNGSGTPDFFHTDEGKAKIAEFHRNRTGRVEHRTTRHTTSNIQVIPEADDRAKVTFVVANYGSDGPPPITDLGGPSLVSQVNADCIRGDDGLWRFNTMSGIPIFIGTDPYTVSELLGKKA